MFCTGVKEIPKYSLIFAWVLCLLHDFDCAFMGFIVLLIFGCVLHGFYRFVDVWLCVAMVLSLCLCVAWVLLFC